MPKIIRTFILTIFLALISCGTQKSMTPEISPASPLSTPTMAPATETPTATATDRPAPTATPEVVELNNDAMKAEIDQLATAFLQQDKNSGMGIAVVARDPQTGQLEAMMLNYGMTAKENGQPVTSDTVYEIGSVTKVFTGILLAEAVNSGTVQLNDPIQKYLPPGIKAPMYKDIPITLLNLATHRSSLPRDIDTDTLPEMYGWLSKVHLASPPGSQYIYSNAGYSLLGDILARLSGKDFGALEFSSISQPLGMPDTTETLTQDQTHRLAQGYTYDGSTADYFPDSGAMSSAGYLRSTLQDMTRFLIANLNPDSTPLAASIKLAQVSQVEGRNPGTGQGLGWDIDQPGTANERISKGGGTSGFTSYISFMADGSSGFVLLTNGMYVENLVPQMLNILNGN
jgi:CubicO group peptidase (beta-lactamase class C family)